MSRVDCNFGRTLNSISIPGYICERTDNGAVLMWDSFLKAKFLGTVEAFDTTYPRTRLVS